MSLLEAIKQQRSKLHPCETIVTLHTGQVFKETVLPDGRNSRFLLHYLNSPGYVVDTKPDLQVAQVLPGLCMGSQDVLQDQALMLSHRITHVLSIGVKPDGLGSVFQCLFVEALDLPETNLLHILEQSIPFIHRVRRAQGCIFVHCNAGVSRSASVVIGYLIKEGMSFNQAYQYLKERRKAVRPNDGFVQQLKEYEAALRGKEL